MIRAVPMHAAAVAFVTLFAAAAARADDDGWQWLRSKNRHVERGNEKMTAGDAKAALEHYDAAARELPSEGGVHLNRGLARLASGDVAGSREAFRLALDPPASPAVRADAHYDLGIGFYREADTLAGEERHDEAQKLFREAADAFRQALRLRPGDRNAAWNLELAARRVREQEEKQRQKEEQEQQKDEQQQEGEKQGEQKQDEEQPQEQPQEQNQEEEKQGERKQEEEKQGEQKQEEKKQGEQKQDGEQEQPEPKPAQKPEEQARPEHAKPKALPSDVARALDALQDSEENLERLKARMRSQRERRRPEKDW